MLGLLSCGLLLVALQPALSINVYLNPPGLARAQRLESFEPFRDVSGASYNDEPFVGQGARNSLLLTVEESDADAILPSALKPSFKLSSPPVESLYSVISTYLNRARHAYASVYEASPSLAHFNNLQHLTTFLNEAEESEFSAIDLSGLATVRKTYGVASDEFAQAASTIREFLERITAQKVQLAILTYTPLPTVHYSKRQSDAMQSQTPLPPDHAPPQEPIGSVSTCFASEDACSESTDSCSGRGQCVQATKAGKTCFVCTCGVTKTGEGSQTKTEYWVGESCERKDVSGPFVLLTGTVIIIALVAVGAISLLVSAGGEELPSTLMGSAVHAKKD
ncbi:hypothetical protein BDZ89DRAFT_1082228 [Hymenopellis radicata]|nr:hypothetical protein BDZ89DRAFT_1082228 [Hymenopellis radicata]